MDPEALLWSIALLPAMVVTASLAICGVLFVLRTRRKTKPWVTPAEPATFRVPVGPLMEIRPRPYIPRPPPPTNEELKRLAKRLKLSHEKKPERKAKDLN